MMAVAVKKLAWKDIKDLPEYQGRTELVDGDLVMSPVPSTHHQDICIRLGVVVLPFVSQRDLGKFYTLPVHVVLAEHVHYEPDLCFIAKGRLDIIQEAGIEGPPDLIVEVTSESNRTHDTVVKFRDYERYGVREYWLVDPRDAHIRVFLLKNGRYVLLGVFRRGDRIVSHVFDGVSLDPAQIF